MKRDYDFSKGTRGAVVAPDPGKIRITIRLDEDIIEKTLRRVIREELKKKGAA